MRSARPRRRARAEGGRRLVAGAALALALAAPGRAVAAGDDGAYGRLDGDVELRAGAGAGLGGAGPALALEVGALYLGTAGVYGTYTDGLGAERIPRTLAAGVRLQPLFLGRYARDLERGPARADLALDSLAFDVGAWWGWGPAAGDVPMTATGLELGLGMSLPLLPRASGPFVGLRGALRLRPAEPRARDDEGVGGLFTVTLSWHRIASFHLVDAGDRR